MLKNNDVFFLMGPTASGKTALSLALAQDLPIEIISVDSTLIYTGMDIGSGKPNQFERQSVPHHLIDIRAPYQSYSAAEFRLDASRLIAEIKSRGHIPLLVGGTMLYFSALQFGLSALPAANLELRQSLILKSKGDGLASLHRRLHELDPFAAARIHPNDPQRIVRALEVIALSGKTFSSFLAHKTPSPYTIHPLALTLERSLLIERITRRFQTMLDQGLITELKALLTDPRIHQDLPSMRSVGYRQVLQYLYGLDSYSVMVDKAVIATRQLAKRQMTWLNNWSVKIDYLPMDTPELSGQSYLKLIQLLEKGV